VTRPGATSRPIVVVGTANIDISLHVDHLPESGETVLGDLGTVCGGKAANQAVAAARLGADVSLVSRVGDDDHGRTLLRELRREGVGTGAVTEIPAGASGVALIMVDRAGNPTIGVAEGVNRFMEITDLDNAPELRDDNTIVVAEMGIPLAVIRRIGELSMLAGFTFILNPAPALAPLDDELWRTIDIVTPNETEAEVLTGLTVYDEQSALRAADRLRELGAGLAIVTLGDRGVAYSSAQGRAVLSAYTVEAVDTTAASDAFNGGLAVALGAGHDHAEAIRYGQAAAALSVTRVGAQSSLPTALEVAEFLANHSNLQEYA
jgi:ribokinase